MTAPQYGVAGSIGSAPDTVALEQVYFTALYDLLYPLAYLFPMKTTQNSGYEIFQANAKVGERLSLAVKRLEDGSVILYAPSGAKATTTVFFTRPTFAAGAVTIKAGSVVSTSDCGRQFVTDNDVVFGATDLGPFSTTVTAVAPGYEYNVRGQTSVASGAATPGDIDTTYSLIMSPVYGDTTFAVYNIDPGVGGTSAFLEGQGRDRNVFQNVGESETSFRFRIRSLADTVSPAAIKRTLTNILGTNNFYFREAGRTELRGFFFDGDDSADVYKDAFDQDSMVMIGVITTGGPFQFQEHVIINDVNGVFLASGWFGGLDGFGNLTVIRENINTIAGIAASATVTGKKSGTVFTIGAVYDTSAVVNPRRFRYMFDFLEFRAFFLVGIPPADLGEFGFAFDVGVHDAFDDLTPYSNGFDGYPVTSGALDLAVWKALDATRAGGVSFNLYVERIGA